MSTEQQMVWLTAAIVIATFLGPVLAVFTTRTIDNLRQRKERKMEVFRALMRSRRNTLSPEYVAALNMVELEFAGRDNVLRPFKTLFDHYQTQPQPNDWQDRLRSLIARLLFAMAKDLGYEMEQLDVMEGGYLPSGWNAMENDRNAVLSAMAKVARGEAAIPVVMVPFPQQGDAPTPTLVSSNSTKIAG